MASIVMSFGIVTEHCFVKGFETKQKSMLKKQINNRLLLLDRAYDVIELLFAKVNVS